MLCYRGQVFEAADRLREILAEQPIDIGQLTCHRLQLRLDARPDFGFKPAALRLLGGDDSLPRRAQVGGLYRELLELCLQRGRQADVVQDESRLCREVGEQSALAWREYLASAFADGDLSDRLPLIPHGQHVRKGRLPGLVWPTRHPTRTVR